MSKDANDNMGKPQRVDIDTNRNLVYIARALRYAALALGFVALDAFAACSRERGVELFRMFEREADGIVQTNGSLCVRTVVDDQCECQFFYSKENGSLRRVREQHGNGDVAIYVYRGKALDYASRMDSKSIGTNQAEIVVTQFVGDGVDTNGVDRIELHMVGGRITESRMFDLKGNPIVVPEAGRGMILDIESVPPVGASTKIGSYDWTIVGKYGDSVFSHNGKTLLHGSLIVGGKYPWIVGHGFMVFSPEEQAALRSSGGVPREWRGRDEYAFIIDMRTDSVEYVAMNDLDQIKAKTGRSLALHRPESFWTYAMSRGGPKRLAKLEEALKPPAK